MHLQVQSTALHVTYLTRYLLYTSMVLYTPQNVAHILFDTGLPTDLRHLGNPVKPWRVHEWNTLQNPGSQGFTVGSDTRVNTAAKFTGFEPGIDAIHDSPSQHRTDKSQPVGILDAACHFFHQFTQGEVVEAHVISSKSVQKHTQSGPRID